MITMRIFLFQLTRLMRGVTKLIILMKIKMLFQLTRLMRGVTVGFAAIDTTSPISTHTPHARRDLNHHDYHEYIAISTHTPHARRDLIVLQCQTDIHPISTHTPHARRDHSFFHNNYSFFISTHTPHARRDLKKIQRRHILGLFQLTRLMRGVTIYD